jgi:hypothetical protein
VCIFLHDIGHIGLQYLDDYNQKKVHWRLGADIAGGLFGIKGFLLCAGHCKYSQYPLSKLYAADKYSWLLAPRWWLLSNVFVEPELGLGFSKPGEAVDKFRVAIRESAESGVMAETHDFYLKYAGAANGKRS